MYTRALIAMLFIAGLLYAGHYFWAQRLAQEAEAENATSLSTALGKEVPLITIEHSERDDPTALIVQSIDTPKVKILSDPTTADRANAYIARFIEDTLDRFRDESVRGAQSVSTSTVTINTLTLSAKVLLVTPKLLTIVFTESTMLAQIPHPQKFTRYITFDLLLAKPVESKDLFTSTGVIAQITDAALTLDDTHLLKREQIEQSLTRDDQHALIKDGLLLSIDTDEDPTTKTRTSRELLLPFATIDGFINKEIRGILLSEQEDIRMATPDGAQ